MEFDPTATREILNRLREVLPPHGNEPLLTKLSDRQLKAFIRGVTEAGNALLNLADRLDPVRPPSLVLDLKDPKITGMLIGKALEEVDPIPLANVPRFYGSGVYALYYQGTFKAYAPIRGARCPIYVGKADPAKADATTPREQGAVIWARLKRDARRISGSGNLRINDFTCRYLVTKNGLQDRVRDLLIDRYLPVWNTACIGFEND